MRASAASSRPPYVHWQGSALTRTLAHGITITWADGNGHYVGCAEPRRNGHFDANSRIELYLETPRWRQQFENWHCRRRLEVLCTTRERADAWGQPVDPQVLEQRKRAFVHRGEVEASLDAAAHTECRSWVAGFLHRNGLRQRYFGFDGGALDLGEAFTTLIWAELNHDCGSLANSALHSGTLRMHWFETWTRRREHRLPLHLGDFKRHIAQVLSSPW